MAYIIIRRNIARRVNPRDLAFRITSRGSIPVGLQNGDLQYETSEANKDHWNSLNESSQESLFRRYFQEHIDLEELIEEDKRNREI